MRCLSAQEACLRAHEACGIDVAIVPATSLLCSTNADPGMQLSLKQTQRLWLCCVGGEEYVPKAKKGRKAMANVPSVVLPHHLDTALQVPNPPVSVNVRGRSNEEASNNVKCQTMRCPCIFQGDVQWPWTSSYQGGNKGGQAPRCRLITT